MCEFFSFIQDAKGNIYYFNLEQRKQIHKSHAVTINKRTITGISNADSHDSIACAFITTAWPKCPGDVVNKYEIGLCTDKPLLVKDDIIIPRSHIKGGLADDAQRWMNIFVKSKEFADICRYTIGRRRSSSWHNATRRIAAELMALSSKNLTQEDMELIVEVCPRKLPLFHKSITSISVKAQQHLLTHNEHKDKNLAKFITDDGLVAYFKAKSGSRELTANMVTTSLVNRIAGEAGKSAYLFIKSIAHLPNIAPVIGRILSKVSTSDRAFLACYERPAVRLAVLTYIIKFESINYFIKNLDDDDAATCLSLIKKSGIKISRDKNLVLHAIAGRAIKSLEK